MEPRLKVTSCRREDSTMTVRRASGASANALNRSKARLSQFGVLACAVALALALITGQAQALSIPDSSAPHAPQRAAVQGPPPVRVSTLWSTLALHPYTSCWSTGNAGMCYDGRPSHPLPSTGATAGPVRLTFARDGWRFQITVTDQNGDQTRVRMVRKSPRSWRLALGVLPDGRYRADVFGRGPQGDVATAFAFTLN